MHHFTSKKLNFEWEKTNHLRIQVINNILKKTKEKRYLEIGCDLNQSWSTSVELVCGDEHTFTIN